jgi:two-component system NarL family response regulator
VFFIRDAKKQVPALNTIRIFVAEPHEVTRKGLVALLNMIDGLEVVGEAADGWETVARFDTACPDVILLDLHLPRLSGVEAIRRIHHHAPHARFIVLSTYDHDEDIYRALDAGAHAYLLAGITTVRFNLGLPLSSSLAPVAYRGFGVSTI